MEQYEQGGMPSALHQTTLRVNSLSISDGQPNQQRKRNREVEDHSFRVDKMSEAPSSIPRMNAVLTPEEYLLQRLPRDDSLNNAMSMVPPWIGHSNSGRSNGSTGSGSLLEFMAQDSHSSMLMSLDKLGQANPTPPPDKMASGQNMLNLSQQGSLLLGSSAPSLLGSQSAMSMLGSQTNMFGISGRNSPPTSYQGFIPQQQQQQQQPFMTFTNPSQQMPVQAMSMQGQQIPVQTMTMQGQQIPMGQISQNSNGLLQSQNSLSFGLPSQNSLTLGLNNQNSLNGGTSFQLQQQNSLNSGLFGVGGGSFLNQAFGSGASLSGFGAAPQAPNLSLGSHQMGYDASFGSLPGQLESFLNTMGPRQSHAVPELPQPSLFGNIVNHHQQPPELFGTMNQNSPPKMKKLVGTTTTTTKPAKSRAAVNGNTEKYVSWSPEQEAELTEAVKLLGTSDWDAVASRISGHRTGPQCSRHWENKLSPNIKRGQWSPEEDEALRALVEKAQARGLGLLDIPWEDIKPYIPGRTLKQVRERWRSNLDPSIIRGDWTQEEDEIIIHMRDVQGLGWASIARALKGRTEHSVKTRHRSMQRAQKRPWTQKEDHVIIELVKTGANWTAIANELKNRTPASVQSRWSELSARG